MKNLSIVMPVYNSEFYLSDSIGSILQQSMADWELIIVDDGSTDRGPDIIRNYDDSRIRLLCNSHNYIQSLNLGIQEARGKYLVRMDADDIMLPHRLQKQWEFMESHPEIDVCGSWAESFGNRQGMMQVNTVHERIIAFLLFGNQMIHPSVIMRHSILNRIPGKLYKEGYPCGEDYKLWADLAIQGFRFANMPEVLLRYRKSDQQVTQQRKYEMLETTTKIQLEYAERVMEKITEKEERFHDFFDQLIELSNEKLIRANQMLRIVFLIYNEFLNNQD